MYKPTKRVVAGLLVAGMMVSLGGMNLNAQAGQIYDSSNVGIADKVGEYIENTTSDDPIADLTAGAVTKNDVAGLSVKAEEKTETVEASDVAEVSADDASLETATETNASPTDAKIYKQFQDRAVVTVDSKVNIRTEPSTDADVVGVLERGGICLVDEIGDEWTKIESGTCVGYIANEFLAYGDDAGTWCEDNGISRTAVVSTVTLKVRESKDEESECLTLIPEGEEYYVYSVSDEWTEVCIDDDIRGFVKSDYVDVTFDNPRAVSVEEQAEADRIAKEEADRAWLAYLAEQEALAQQAQQQQQTQQTQTAAQTQEAPAQQTQQTQEVAPAAQTQEAAPATQTQEAAPAAQETPATEAPATEAPTEAPTAAPAPVAAPAGSSGVDLANYACQYVGVIPYIWGGESLSSGVDCSGFTMCLYALYGISLPHNAAAQSGYGVEVSLSDLQPGDLLFYSSGGGINHVAIYIGGGSIVHASNSRDGIKISSYNYRTPAKAIRLFGQ